MGEGEVGIRNLTGALKVLLLFLSILGLVVPSVLGWVNFDKRIDLVEDAQVKHEVVDNRKWESADEEFDKLNDQVVDIKLNIKGLSTQYVEILRRLDEMNRKLDNFEVM